MSKFNDYFRKLVSGTQKSPAETNTAEKTAEPQKTAANHVLSGKSAAKIHPENPFEKSAKDSELLAVYSDSDKLLQPKPLADDLHGINTVLNGYIAFYSAISVLSSGAVGFYGSDFILPVSPELSILAGSAAALFALVLAGINEKVKLFGLNRYFKARPAERNQNIVTLIFVTAAISITISAAGGALISYNITDKTAEIQTNQFAAIDSVNAVFDSQISALQAASESAQSSLKTHKTGWRANIARQDLEKAAGRISELQNQKKESLGTLQSNTNEAISSDTGKREKYAKISAAIVTVLELLFIFFHAIFWSNHRKIKTEKENHISASDNVPVQIISPDYLSSLFGQFGSGPIPAGLNMYGTNQNNQFAAPQPAPERQPIGFRQKTESVNAKSNTESVNTEGVNTEGVIGNGNRICKNCGNGYTYGHAAQKYCAEGCRIAAWEKRTGRTVKKGGSAK